MQIGQQTQQHIGRRWHSLAELVQKTTLGRSNIYELIKRGEFPEPHKFGRRSLWKGEEVDAWMKSVEAGEE